MPNIETNIFSWAAHVASGIKLDKIEFCVNESRKYCGRSKASILRDMLHCARKFGAGYYDYLIFGFYDLNDALRKTYFTRLINKKYDMYMNDPDRTAQLNSKSGAYTMFEDLLRRDSLKVATATDAQLAEFWATHPRIFAKIDDGACSLGAERFEEGRFATAEEFVAYVRKQKLSVVEEVLVNHPDIARVYPDALNTTRILTIIDDGGTVHAPLAAQKFGRDGHYVDAHSMHVPITLSTATINYPAHNGNTEYHEYYAVHPNTGESIVGLKIPYLDEALELAKEAASRVPEVRYISWDIGITPTGPAIVEANTFGAYEFWQLPGQTGINGPRGGGWLPLACELCPGFKY